MELLGQYMLMMVMCMRGRWILLEPEMALGYFILIQWLKWDGFRMIIWNKIMQNLMLGVMMRRRKKLMIG